MNFILPRAYAVVILAGMLAPPAFALDSDKEQPATLEADDFEFDLASGARIYRGNVVFRRGSLRLECAELVTYHNEDGDLEKGVCNGTPGKFKQRPEGRDSDALGKALSITLDRANGVLILDGRAEVEMAGNRIQGQLIKYDLETKKITAADAAHGETAPVTTAETGEAESGRPRLLIPPRNTQSQDQ